MINQYWVEFQLTKPDSMLTYFTPVVNFHLEMDIAQPFVIVNFASIHGVFHAKSDKTKQAYGEIANIFTLDCLTTRYLAAYENSFSDFKKRIHCWRNNGQ